MNTMVAVASLDEDI